MQVGGTELASGLQASLTQQQIATTVLSKAHDAQKAAGEAAVSLIESAVDEVGQAVDSQGQGHQLDLTV